MYDLVMNPTLNPGIVAENLKRAMALRQMSATDLARESGVSKSTISLILSGKNHHTTAIVVARLAWALHVSVDYLVGLSDTMGPTPLMLGDLLVELTRVARKLSSKRQEDLLLMARTYLDAAEQEATDEEMNQLLNLVREFGGVDSLSKLLDVLEDRPAGTSPDVPPDDEVEQPPQGDE